MNKKHLKHLIEKYQASSGILHVDGLWGPRTQKYMESSSDFSLEDKDLLTRTWELASQDVGKGGSPGLNNGGPYVTSLRKAAGFPSHVRGSWCAVFVSAVLLKAGGPNTLKSRGAYRLVEKFTQHPNGREVLVEDLEPGKCYIACWKRNRWRTHREAHVRLIYLEDHGRIAMIGGNERGDKVNVTTVDIREFTEDLLLIAEYTE